MTKPNGTIKDSLSLRSPGVISTTFLNFFTSFDHIPPSLFDEQ